MPALGVIATLMLGCNNDPVSSRPENTYDARVSGALTRDLQGTARFEFGNGGYGGPVLSLLLGTGTSDDLIVLQIRSTEPPAEGKYPINFATEPVEGAWIASYVTFNNGQMRDQFSATEGVVRILQSSAGRIRGSFELKGEGTTGGSSAQAAAEVTIVGAFDAGRN